MKKLFAAALAAILATPAAADVVTLSDQHLSGGGVGRTYKRVVAFNETGDTVRLDARSITSAGTFWLMANGACIVSPDTIVEFHGPQSGLGQAVFALTLVPVNHSFMPRAKADWIRREMADFYNAGYPGLGDWFLASGAADRAGAYVVKVRASELNRAFGVRICAS